MSFMPQHPVTKAFFAAPFRDHAGQRATTEAAFQALPGAFANRNRLHQFFLDIFVPPSGAWAFKPNGKTGTSSTLEFLFALEFGLPISAATGDDFNPDQIVHRLAEARLFARLPEHPDVTEVQASLAQMLRLTTIRHPATRALSGYRYLCRAHRCGAAAFAVQRLRMTAIAGFDWDSHTDTPDGFLRFLDWVAAEEEMGGWMTDPHFRPQVVNVRPDILRPDIIGRTEAMEDFFTAICARLDRPRPSAQPPRNRQPQVDAADYLGPPALDRITRIFAADFEAFTYDPANPECRA